MAMRMTDPEAYVEQMGRLLGLEMDAERRAAVLAHFLLLADQAEALLDFPLEETVEPAGHFEP